MAGKKKVKEGEATEIDESLSLEEQIIAKNEGLTFFSSDKNSNVDEWLSTGSPLLDKAISNGLGLPVGRMTLILGAKSSGKSTLIANIIASAQKTKDALCVLFDTEYAMINTWAATNSVDIDKLLIDQPSCVEELFEKLEKITTLAVKTNRMVLLVWDSVAQTAVREEILAEETGTGAAYGAHSRIISAGLRKVTQLIGKNRVVLIIVNQLKTDINSSYGGSTYLARKPLDFYSSCTIECTQVSKEKNSKDEFVGMKTNMKVTKNKVSAPYREATLQISFEKGLDRAYEAIQIAIQEGRILPRGAYKEIVVPCPNCDRDIIFDKRSKKEVIVTTGKKDGKKCEVCSGEMVVGREGYPKFYDSAAFDYFEKRDGLQEWLTYNTGPLKLEDEARPKFLF